MLLELEHVSKIYGELKALNDINLQVEEGEWLAIVGSSGSGKTTLMNIIGCLDTPTLGSVKLEGRKLEDLNQHALADIRKGVVGLVFQKFHLVPHLTALENVMVAQYYHSVVDKQQALDALKDVGLLERAHHLPSELSGGEQQRVCIARALINCPKLILADEPTGNLDEVNEKIVLDIFKSLHEQGTTIIVVTHDALVASFAQREIVLNHGVITAERKHDNASSNSLETANSSNSTQAVFSQADSNVSHLDDMVASRASKNTISDSASPHDEDAAYSSHRDDGDYRSSITKAAKVNL